MKKNNHFLDAAAILREAAQNGVAPAAQLCVRHRGKIVTSACFGDVPAKTGRMPVQPLTLFDLASVSKLFTTAAFMRLVEKKRVSLDEAVSAVLPEFTGLRDIAPYENPLAIQELIDVSHGFTTPVDAARITFRQLLRHSSGLPAWRPLYLQPNSGLAKEFVLSTFFSYEPDNDVVYSDLGFMLLGWAVEALTGETLAEAVQSLVLTPLHLAETGYRPIAEGLSVPLPFALDGIAPTGYCQVRGKPLCGEVNDENCARLGGVAGHAGVFSTAEELSVLGQTFLDPAGYLKKQTLNEMTRQQAVSRDGLNRRGIGLQLWSPDPDASYAPLSPESFGHTGFTGTCLWVDPRRSLVIALLTNEVFHGRQDRKIAALRRGVIARVIEEIDRG